MSELLRKSKILPPKLVYDLDWEMEPDELSKSLSKTPVGLGDILKDHFRFAQDHGGNLYYYKNGVYLANGKDMIEFQIQKIMKSCGTITSWRSRLPIEVLNYIRPTCPMIFDKPHTHVLNLKNGVFHFLHKRLVPHDPDYITTTQLPIEYTPEAKCPKWEKFISEVFPEQPDTEIVWRIIAWLMLPHTFNQKALMLVGEGSNGKSTLLNGIVSFLGSNNVSNLSLLRMKEKFSAPTLMGKLANIVPDLSEERIKDTSIFKQLIVNEEITGEYKHGEVFKFKPFARHVFSSYKMPESEDDSAGFYRRFDTIKFSAKFQVDPDKGRAIENGLHDPDELSGVLNKALAVRLDVSRNGLMIPEVLKISVQEHKKQNDPLIEWFDDELEIHLETYIPKRELYQEYTKVAGKYPVSIGKFGQKLKEHFNLEKDVQRSVLIDSKLNIFKKQVWCYKGIRLKNSLESLQAHYVAESPDDGENDEKQRLN